LSHFVQILDFIPTLVGPDGHKREPSELKVLTFSSEKARDTFLAILNSSLFYWLLTVFSDCRNLNKREVHSVRFDLARAGDDTAAALAKLSRALMVDIRKNSRVLTINYKKHGTMKIQCTYPRASKPILDEIDRVLVRHYGFTDEELDFIINYDIKYRMGQEESEEDE
jgi:hypothetical protein